MSNINQAAAAARDSHRTADGRFGEQHHPEPAPDVLDDQPVPIGSLGLQPGEQLQVGEDEHADPDIETLTISRDADGTFWAEGGPTIYFGAAAPEGTDPDEYLDRNSHRVQAFAADIFAARAQFDDTATDGRIMFRARLDPDTDTSQVCQTLHDHTRLDDLVQDLADDSQEHGRSALSHALAAHFEACDGAALQPRQVTVPDGAGYSQEQMDRAVQTARDHIPIQRQVTSPNHRTGFVIVAYTHPQGHTTLHVHEESAWQEPAERPMLPWSPPQGCKVATVDLDGHAEQATQD